MSVVALVGHQWRRHRIPLAAMTGAATLFHFLLTRMAPMGGESWVTRAMESVPPELLALAGGGLSSQISAGAFLGLGYGHPFFQLLLGAWAVRVSCGAMAGELGIGTMDLMASRPVPRWHFVAAGALSAFAGLAVIGLGAWSGTALGSSVRGLGVGKQLAPVASGALLLFVAWASVGLLISAGRRDAGSAIAWTSGIIATSFAFDYLARLWQPLAGARFLSLFRWYEPQALLASGVDGRSVAVLGGVAIVAVIAAIVVFQRRDL